MQKNSYQRLREEDRHMIYRMRKAGNTQQQIATILGYSQSTISKELSRNRGQRSYRPKQAHEKSLIRQSNKASRSPVISGVLKTEVIERLNRKRYDDWEADLIAGCRGGGHLLSLYERKSRLGKLILLESKDAESTADAIIAALKEMCVYTITYDNGLKFAGHEKVSKALGANGYFCQPYHSWEKGGVENFNGLVRQYFPKGTNFLNFSEASLAEIQTELNQRPRKSLNYQSPDNLKHKLAA